MTTLLGLDLGTSSFKVSAYEASGSHLGDLSRSTPWRDGPSGMELDPEEFALAVHMLVNDCASEFAAGPVAAVGVTGMAETMFVELEDGQLLAARAWNQRMAKTTPQPDPETFSRTGLLDAARTPLVELRLIADAGVEVRSWSGLPEYAVQVLGGDPVAERSLAARSGLIDVVTGSWSAALLAWAGVGGLALPDLQPAGRDSGRVDAGSCAGATLTVAGHDHVTAMLGAGAADGTSVFDSLGTGEAVIAPISATVAGVDLPTVKRFNAAGFNVSLGVGEDDVIALAGLGTGSRLNLLLAALIEGGFAREDVLRADAAPSEGEERDALRRLPLSAVDLLNRLFGPQWQELRTSGEAAVVVREHISDLAAARSLWWAAVVWASRNARGALDALARLAPQATRVVASGGWLGNPGIRAVRERILGAFTVADVEQCGTRGAALLAGLAAGVYPSRSEFPAPAPAPATR